MKGYTGKILHIDLTNESFFVEEPSEKFYRAYLGGSCMGTYYVMNSVKPGVDPLSKDNILAFNIGPLAGLAISGASRHSVTCKSPQTGTIAASEAGGYWAPELKFAGFDGLIIKGKASKPVYLWIHDGEYELRDASNIWGKETKESQEIIKDELNDPKVRVAQIGPAGENKVIYANIVNELAHFNGRNGMGAVMGSKNLKAIAVRGTKVPNFYDKKSIIELAKKGAKRVKEEEGYIGFKKYGTDNVVNEHIGTGGLPTKNWTSGVFEGQDNLTAEAWSEQTIKPGTCFGCAQSCKRHVDPKKVSDIDSAYGGPEYETVGMCGSNLGISDQIAICKINEICAKYAMDTISFGGTVSFAMECFENGVITTKETGGLELNFGNSDAVIELAELTGKREGFGNLIADGSLKLSKIWGTESEKYIVHVKGKEFPAHMPQIKASLALAYAVVPYAADHVSSQYDATIGTEPIPYQMAGIGFDRAEDPTELNAEKSKLTYRTMVGFSMFDSACVCVLAISFWSIFDLHDLVNLVNYATGWKTTLYELMMIGEKRIQMMRAFNTKEGFDTNDDVLPEKMFVPLKGGLTDGAVVNKDDFFKTRDLFYDFAGWDKETGKPIESRLRILNLEWVLDYLNK